MTPNHIYNTNISWKVYQYLVIFSWHLYGEESMDTFLQSWVIVLDQLVSEGKACNWSDMLAHQLKEQVTRARQSPKGMQAEIYVYAYILDAICAWQEFPRLKWAWTQAETAVNTYCKMLSECSFRVVITWLSNNFVTSVYKMIFEQDPPCMLKAAMEALTDIADWYASPSDTFIWMYNVEKPPHVLPKFSLEIVIMHEVAYHISVGLSARLHRKKKGPWSSLSLWIRIYKIQNFKHANVEAEQMKKYPFNAWSYNLYNALSCEIPLH